MEKMSLKNIKEVLSRDEMKEIMAGYYLPEQCGLNRWAYNVCFQNFDTNCMRQLNNWYYWNC